MKTLADTSIWIDGIRSKDSWLARTLAATDSIAYTEPVRMELLMGARDEGEWEELSRFIMGGALIPLDPASDFDAAAAISGMGRRRGLTAGKEDCLILAVAQRTHASFVTRDKRQADLGRIVGVRVLS